MLFLLLTSIVILTLVLFRRQLKALLIAITGIFTDEVLDKYNTAALTVGVLSLGAIILIGIHQYQYLSMDSLPEHVQKTLHILDKLESLANDLIIGSFFTFLYRIHTVKKDKSEELRQANVEENAGMENTSDNQDESSKPTN